jgi:hypothetical protein
MHLRVLAIADTGSYLAAGAGGRCCLFTLDAGPHVELGDLLAGEFAPRRDPRCLARNLTQNQDVVVRVQRADSSPSRLIGFLIHQLLPHPSVVLTLVRRFPADSEALAPALQALAE